MPGDRTRYRQEETLCESLMDFVDRLNKLCISLASRFPNHFTILFPPDSLSFRRPGGLSPGQSSPCILHSGTIPIEFFLKGRRYFQNCIRQIYYDILFYCCVFFFYEGNIYLFINDTNRTFMKHARLINKVPQINVSTALILRHRNSIMRLIILNIDIINILNITYTKFRVTVPWSSTFFINQIKYKLKLSIKDFFIAWHLQRLCPKPCWLQEFLVRTLV